MKSEQILCSKCIWHRTEHPAKGLSRHPASGRHVEVRQSDHHQKITMEDKTVMVRIPGTLISVRPVAEMKLTNQTH